MTTTSSSRWPPTTPAPGAWSDTDAVPPYRETRDYVRKITAAAGSTAPQRESVIYRWTETVEGRTRTRYSNVPPKDQPYEIVGKR